MANYLEVIRGLNKIPGIGKKSAERITFYFLESDVGETEDLLEKIRSFITLTKKCSTCGLISKNNPCNICSSPKRDRNVICVVKSIQDALIIERSKIYKGLYHVTGKLISPLDDCYTLPESVMSKLLKRIAQSTEEVSHDASKHDANKQGVEEVIFALENTQAGRMTMEYLMEKLKSVNPALKFSTIAVGVPVGTSLEYVDKETLRTSINHRFTVER